MRLSNAYWSTLAQTAKAVSLIRWLLVRAHTDVPAIPTAVGPAAGVVDSVGRPLPGRPALAVRALLFHRLAPRSEPRSSRFLAGTLVSSATYNRPGYLPRPRGSTISGGSIASCSANTRRSGGFRHPRAGLAEAVQCDQEDQGEHVGEQQVANNATDAAKPPLEVAIRNSSEVEGGSSRLPNRYWT